MADQETIESTTETQQTNQQQEPVIENVDTTGGVSGVGVPKEELERFQMMMRDQTELAQSLMRQNAELTKRLNDRPSSTREVSPEQDEKSFWDKPKSSLREMIVEELDARIKPLNDAFRMQERDKQLDKVKEKYADIWPAIERDVKASIETARSQGHDVNEQLLDFLALATSGAYYRGQLATKPNTTTTTRNGTPPVQTRPDPGFIPSAPPKKIAEKEVVKREYTEVERRLMRERGLSEEAWDALQNASPTDFMTITIPGKKKEGVK